MRNRILTTLTLGIALIVPHLHAEQEVLFRAVLDMGDTKSFSLSDPSGAGSQWVKLGGDYAGWTLTDYAPETRTLTLEKNGETMDVIIASASAPTGEEGPAIKEATEVFRLMQFDEMMDATMDQQKKSIIDMQRKMMEQSGQPIDEELLEIQAGAINDAFDLIEWDTLKGDMINIYAETFSRGDLNAMADFYLTPAGKNMVEKQPEIQQKMMQTMMPEMMKIGPVIQENTQKRMKAYYAKKQAEAKATEE